MIDREKFGCDKALSECRTAASFDEMYESSGMECFNISATKIMEMCLNSRRRLEEIAAFEDKTLPELLKNYSDSEADCPIYVRYLEDTGKYPTLTI